MPWYRSATAVESIFIFPYTPDFVVFPTFFCHRYLARFQRRNRLKALEMSYLLSRKSRKMGGNLGSSMVICAGYSQTAQMDQRRRKKERPVGRVLLHLQSCANNQRTCFFKFHTLQSVQEGPVLSGAHHKVGEGLKMPGPRSEATMARSTTTKSQIFLR
jgi:hypothetical protein